NEDGSSAPTHAAVIFDHSSKTFRNEIFPDYKANRPEPPEDLRPQFPLTRRCDPRLQHRLHRDRRVRGR
ncbi:DNA polymerase I, partial [marine sediment metagenome]